MIVRFNRLLFRTIWLVSLCGLLTSCQDQSPKMSTISHSSSVGNTGGTTGGTNTGPTTPVRPSDAIFFKSDFCGCNDTKPVTYGNCATFCADKSTGSKGIFYANFTVTEAISLGGLGNVYGWCTQLLTPPTTGTTTSSSSTPTVNATCALEAKDDSGNIVSGIAAVPISGTNSITANIDALQFDKTYVLTLVETSSGARSNSIQIIKFSQDIPLTSLGPLKNAPISQYTCLYRTYQTDSSTSDIFWLNVSRLHFYFLPAMPPAPITAGTSNLVCHDIFNPAYGATDDASYPRLELIQDVFNLWDLKDPRFYDNNNNGKLDINEVIVQKTKNFGGSISADTNFFSKFKWPGSPQTSADAGNSSATDIGYYMAPWIDTSTYKSYCLNSTHYNSSNPLFMALRDIIGVDTEGLYIGVKPPEAVTLTSGTTTSTASDYILIRETDLKKVWFYLKNNTIPTAPTDANVADVAVYFYYPLNVASPFVKTSTQRMYQVKGAAELNNTNVTTSGANASGTATTYPPHDRKIGCIPKF
jgi:hypothetical protein